MSETKEFDFAVFIGRFQPFHQGHLQVIQSGLAQADKLIVLIGSSWQARNPRNPWLHSEREHMIRACLSEDENQERCGSCLAECVRIIKDEQP